jgi:hypothetical protein
MFNLYGKNELVAIAMFFHLQRVVIKPFLFAYGNILEVERQKLGHLFWGKGIALSGVVWFWIYLSTCVVVASCQAEKASH